MVEETDNADIDSILSFILKLLNSLFSDLPQDVCKSRRFQTLIWQKLVPSLIGALQADSQFDASFETKIQLALHLLDRKESVRKKKLVFLVSLELIRIFGSIQHIRQVLESLLHRLLISALPEDRCETLKSLNSAFSSLEFVLPLCAPPFHDECSSTPSKDMGLFRLIVVCMEDACLVKDPEAIDVCVENIRNLLELLDQIIKIQDHNDKKEVSLPKEYVQVINETFATMSDSSYRGPSEYQAKVKYQRKTCSRSSTPISSTALTALSSPAPLSDSSSDETSEPQLPPRFVSEHHKESVNAFSALQDAARLFVKNLVDNNLCPFMNQRSIIHLDDQLQKFAYRSCKGKVNSFLSTLSDNYLGESFTLLSK
ncbi:uncharacterized protein LOC136026449 [Artemia franciscana]|uniref:uncharacterized protein LOC136026449 n=1 Tax=Artemia franciscana TaxID=6661 RepID=UPI0032DBB968